MSTAASDGAGNVIGSTGEGGADGGPPPGLQHSHPQSAVVAVPPQHREPPAGVGADTPVAGPEKKRHLAHEGSHDRRIGDQPEKKAMELGGCKPTAPCFCSKISTNCILLDVKNISSNFHRVCINVKIFLYLIFVKYVKS